ncbi:MAG: helix-turn-helix transcriptional regulator [Muribaculaceae bacterium]|nr:helix-turn-helix transcriptional regulator [Muribaculaceae bacterium]
MKFNREKLQQLAEPMPDSDRQQMGYQIENRDWLLLSVKLALKIRSLMDAEGITQSELARRMGVSPAQVTKILSGQENLGLKTIAKVSAALGKPLFIVDIEENTHAASMHATAGYDTFPIFIKSEPVDKNISSAYASYNIVKKIAYS